MGNVSGNTGLDGGLGPVRQVLMQPTSFCNINCSYCYIPGTLRAVSNRMSVDVAAHAIQLVWDSGLCDGALELRWHDGEPLARGKDFYREIFTRVRACTPQSVRTYHSVQTNGVLLDDEWADLFQEFGVIVGVSLDGPADVHDAWRVDRAGRGTHARAIAGIRHLQDAGVPFDVIAVVTDASLSRAAEIYEYFRAFGVRQLALNIDDFALWRNDPENAEERIKAFYSEMFLRWRTGAMVIREFDDLRDRIAHAASPVRSLTATPLGIVSVTAEGGLSTFSPELVSLPEVVGASYIFGSVDLEKLTDMQCDSQFKTARAAVEEGVVNCKAQCPYFDICGGGVPANKLYETGSFASTETLACRVRIKHIGDLIMDDLLLQITANSAV